MDKQEFLTGPLARAWSMRTSIRFLPPQLPNPDHHGQWPAAEDEFQSLISQPDLLNHPPTGQGIPYPGLVDLHAPVVPVAVPGALPAAVPAVVPVNNPAAYVNPGAVGDVPALYNPAPVYQQINFDYHGTPATPTSHAGTRTRALPITPAGARTGPPAPVPGATSDHEQSVLDALVFRQLYSSWANVPQYQEQQQVGVGYLFTPIDDPELYNLFLHPSLVDHPLDQQSPQFFELLEHLPQVVYVQEATGYVSFTVTPLKTFVSEMPLQAAVTAYFAQYVEHLHLSPSISLGQLFQAAMDNGQWAFEFDTNIDVIDGMAGPCDFEEQADDGEREIANALEASHHVSLQYLSLIHI